MTWTKLGAEFFDQVADAGLSDAAARTHTELIAALYTFDRDNVTDMRIPKRAIAKYTHSPDAETAIKELAGVGYWRDDGQDWTLIHHADVVMALVSQRLKKRRDRKSQAAKRTREKPVIADVSDDRSADVSAGTVRQTCT